MSVADPLPARFAGTPIDLVRQVSCRANCDDAGIYWKGSLALRRRWIRLAYLLPLAVLECASERAPVREQAMAGNLKVGAEFGC